MDGVWVGWIDGVAEVGIDEGEVVGKVDGDIDDGVGSSVGL